MLQEHIIKEMIYLNINTKNLVPISQLPRHLNGRGFNRINSCEQLAEDEDISEISKRIIEKNRKIYDELAK